MEIKYIAFDGKEFDEEWDCLDYESATRYQFFKNDFTLLDDNFQQIKDFDNTDEAYFIKINTIAGLKALREYGTEYSDDWGIGEFYFDTETEKWRPLQGAIQNIQEQLERLQKAQLLLNQGGE